MPNIRCLTFFMGISLWIRCAKPLKTGEKYVDNLWKIWGKLPFLPLLLPKNIKNTYREAWPLCKYPHILKFLYLNAILSAGEHV